MDLDTYEALGKTHDFEAQFDLDLNDFPLDDEETLLRGLPTQDSDLLSHETYSNLQFPSYIKPCLLETDAAVALSNAAVPLSAESSGASANALLEAQLTGPIYDQELHGMNTDDEPALRVQPSTIVSTSLYNAKEAECRPPTIRKEWEDMQPHITALYIDQKETLERTMSIMSEDHNFNAT